MWRRQLSDVQEIVRAAQPIPVGASAEYEPPNLTDQSPLTEAIKERETKFFHLHVFDCCDEDGDVVEILVNGASFITIPNTHAGSALSVPLAPGNNTIALRGIRDGGGGITVALETGAEPLRLRALRAGESLRVRIP